MKILIVSQNFWPENFQVNGLAQKLAKRGHEVTVLTGLPNYPSGRIDPRYFKIFPFYEKWEAVKIIRVPLVPRGSASNFRLILNYFSFALFATIFAPFLCHDSYDRILVYQPSPITQALPALFLKALKKVPVYLWVQDLWPESLVATKKVKSKTVLRMVSALVRFIYKHCDNIMVSSRAFTSHIENYAISSEKILYFPNSVDETYRPLCLLPSYDKYLLPTGFRLFFAGNIGSAQSINTILNAADILRAKTDIKWIFAGEGSERKVLQDLILERGLQNTVFWIGSYPVSEMAYMFSLMDILLITLSKNDIFALTIPSKLQSYLACAKPILAAIDGEAARVLHESGAGIAVPSEDAFQLADAVLQFQKLSLVERQDMGLKGYNYNFKHFDQQQLLVQLEEWFSR